MGQEELNNQGHLPFRPLDNSMSTQTKYELEAEHWSRAQKSVNSRNHIPSLGSVASFIGGIFGIIGGLLSIILFIFAGIIDLIKRWSADRQSAMEHKRYMERLDKVIANSPKIKGHDTPDSEYEKD